MILLFYGLSGWWWWWWLEFICENNLPFVRILRACSICGFNTHTHEKPYKNTNRQSQNINHINKSWKWRPYNVKKILVILTQVDVDEKMVCMCFIYSNFCVRLGGLFVGSKNHRKPHYIISYPVIIVCCSGCLDFCCCLVCAGFLLYWRGMDGYYYALYLCIRFINQPKLLRIYNNKHRTRYIFLRPNGNGVFFFRLSLYDFYST